MVVPPDMVSLLGNLRVFGRVPGSVSAPRMIPRGPMPRNSRTNSLNCSRRSFVRDILEDERDDHADGETVSDADGGSALGHTTPPLLHRDPYPRSPSQRLNRHSRAVDGPRRLMDLPFALTPLKRSGDDEPTGHTTGVHVNRVSANRTEGAVTGRSFALGTFLHRPSSKNSSIAKKRRSRDIKDSSALPCPFWATRGDPC